MFRIIEIHNSVCEHCDEGKTKAETTQGIIACTTCGAEDPNFVPLISESNFFRNSYKKQGVIETIHSFEFEDMKNCDDLSMSKKEKEILRERCEDTSGFKAENEDINNDPNLSDREKRIKLYESRQKYVKQKMDSYNEECLWYNEICKEEERRAKLAKLAKQAELAKPVKLTEESEDESENESEDESESESQNPKTSDLNPKTTVTSINF